MEGETPEPPESNERRENLNRHVTHLLDILGVTVENVAEHFSLKAAMGPSLPPSTNPAGGSGEIMAEAPQTEGEV